jgi:hypothetical protein
MAETSIQPKLQGSIHIQLNENVKIERLTQIIGRIGGIWGCETCGIQGFDVRITGVDAGKPQV